MKHNFLVAISVIFKYVCRISLVISRFGQFLESACWWLPEQAVIQFLIINILLINNFLYVKKLYSSRSDVSFTSKNILFNVIV